ncbi:unnamed protein product [Somion occarium]|uniref:LysM domain-containing protein n=1 Tax=Somion occarium TaxID=3059160 RepID=A0ABP1CMD9_9APHY
MFAAFKLVAVAAAMSTAYAQILPPDCSRTYTVQSGDFCDKISAEQSVSTFQLADVNKGIIDAACDNLFPGEVLCLGITGQDCTTVHVIAEGDFCASIAGNAGIPISTLLANNPNVNADCSNLGIGEVLCTASEIFVGGGSGTTTIEPPSPGTTTIDPPTELSTLPTPTTVESITAPTGASEGVTSVIETLPTEPSTVSITATVTASSTTV